MSPHTSLTESDVRAMRELGIEHSVIVGRLIQTGEAAKVVQVGLHGDRFANSLTARVVLLRRR